MLFLAERTGNWYDRAPGNRVGRHNWQHWPLSAAHGNKIREGRTDGRHCRHDQGLEVILDVPDWAPYWYGAMSGCYGSPQAVMRNRLQWRPCCVACRHTDTPPPHTHTLIGPSRIGTIKKVWLNYSHACKHDWKIVQMLGVVFHCCPLFIQLKGSMTIIGANREFILFDPDYFLPIPFGKFVGISPIFREPLENENARDPISC